MTDVEKGDWVVALESGEGRTVRGYDLVWFEKDDELQVTSARAQQLSVRAGRDRRVFRISRELVERPRPVGVVPAGAIPADDPRVAWLFEDAARLANRLNLCTDYERIAEQLGVPGRERTFTLKLAVADGVEVTAKVVARSRRLAEQRVVEQFAGQVPAVRAIASGSSS